MIQPWLLWLSGLSASLQTKGSLVQFPVREHASVVGQVPSWGHATERQPHTNVSLPLSFLSPHSKNKDVKSEALACFNDGSLDSYLTPSLKNFTLNGKQELK